VVAERDRVLADDLLVVFTTPWSSTATWLCSHTICGN
jgi:hypothetical protein